MTRRAGSTRGSAASCTSPGRSRSRFRRLRRSLRRFRCLHSALGTARRVGTAGNDAVERVTN